MAAQQITGQRSGSASSVDGCGRQLSAAPKLGRAAGNLADQPIKQPALAGIAAHRWGRRVIAWGLRRASGSREVGTRHQSLRVALGLANLAPNVSRVQLCLARIALSQGDIDTAKRAACAAAAMPGPAQGSPAPLRSCCKSPTRMPPRAALRLCAASVRPPRGLGSCLAT